MLAKFAVNPGMASEQFVEAERFQLSNDYWYFFDASDRITHVIVAKAVGEIERLEA